MSGIISIILVLGALIFFHELGHFLVARSLGIGVKTFSIGFGPALLSWKGKKTRYQLSAVPLGGYVSLLGESDDDEIPAPFTAKESFALRPPLHRLLVVMAGSVFNLIMAWFIFWGLAATGHGQIMPKVDLVMPDSPAAAVGIQQGDLIRSINGRNIVSWEDLLFEVQQSKGAELEIVLERDGAFHTVHAAPELKTGELKSGKKVQAWLLGMASSGEPLKLGFFASGVEGFKETGRKITLIGRVVSDIVTGRGSVKDLGGPIMVGQAVYDNATYAGLVAVLKLTALLSVNLGLLNLLPIPALDGGHVFFTLVEMIFRRPVPLRLQATATYMGFFLLIGVMIMATAFDIFRLAS